MPGANSATVAAKAPVNAGQVKSGESGKNRDRPRSQIADRNAVKELLRLHQPSWVTSRLWRTGTSTNPPPKNTSPILKKVAISFDSGPAAKNANGIQFTVPLPAAFPGWEAVWVR